MYSPYNFVCRITLHHVQFAQFLYVVLVLHPVYTISMSQLIRITYVVVSSNMLVLAHSAYFTFFMCCE
jgi:hypothetical protein